MANQAIRTCVLFPDGQLVNCIFKKPLNKPEEGKEQQEKELLPELQQLLQQSVVTSYGRWSYVAPESNTLPPPLPLAVAHVLAGEQGPDVRMAADAEDASSVAAFEANHKADLEGRRAVVIRIPSTDRELVLVPVKARTGKDATITPLYWGYAVPVHLLSLASTVLHYSRLVAVFDLDETLLMAHSGDSLKERIRRNNKTKDAKIGELRSLSSDDGSSSPSRIEQQKQLQAELALLEAEGKLLQQDYEMVDFYRNDPQCRVLVRDPGGGMSVAEPTWEKSRNLQGEEVMRPVVRLELNGKPCWFTRIKPESKSTSMIIRPRAGWRALKDYLNGMEDVRQGGMRKHRWDVYICTTAEPEYAVEAWRLLDPESSIFNRDAELVNKRMLCVSHPAKKDLLNVLRWEKAYVDMLEHPGQQSPYIVTQELRALRSDPQTAALSVVVDDRLDVWDEASRKAVLQVMPFHPYKEAAVLDMGPAAAGADAYQAAQDSEQELMRVVGTLREVRSKLYQELDMYIKPDVHRLVNQGVAEGLHAMPFEILQPVTSMAMLLAGTAQQPPAALGQTEKEDRASDLRLLANDQTMARAVAPEGASAVGPGTTGLSPAAAAAAAVPAGAKLVSDPRKRKAAEAAAAAAAIVAELQEQSADGSAAAATASGPQQAGRAGQPQQHGGLLDFDIQGLLQSFEGKFQQSQQQYQQPSQTAGAAADDSRVDQQQAKKQRSSGPLSAVAAATGGTDRAPSPALAAVASAAATPALNNSIGSSDSGASISQYMPAGGVLVQQLPHPVVPKPDVPGSIPPGQVLAVLRAAAAAAPSANDLAAYTDLFPTELRSVVAPSQLLEVLACLQAQSLPGMDNANVQLAMQSEHMQLLQRVGELINSNKGVAHFLKPLMGRGPAAGVFGAAAGHQAAVVTAGHLSGAGTEAGGSMGLQPQQQQQQRPGHWQLQPQQQQQQQGLMVMDMRDMRKESIHLDQTVDFRNLGSRDGGRGSGPGLQLMGLNQPASLEGGNSAYHVATAPQPGSGLVLQQPAAAEGGPLQHMQIQLQTTRLNGQAAATIQGHGTNDPVPGQPLVRGGSPARDLLVRLGNDPDCLSYNYEAMKQCSQNINFRTLCRQYGVKHAIALLQDVSAEKRGPMVQYNMYQGDTRPGQVPDLADNHVTCALMYLGKIWGYGYSQSKKGAKMDAAWDAAANMYVSSIYFEKLPSYRGPRPAGDAGNAAADAAGSNDGANRLQSSGNSGSNQQQQQHMQAAGQPPWQPPPQQPAPFSQQQQQRPGSSGNSSGSGPCEAELRQRFGPRIQFQLRSMQGSTVVMVAELRSAAGKNSQVEVAAEGLGSGLAEAIEQASTALLRALNVPLPAAAAALSQPPMFLGQQQQQQHPGVLVGRSNGDGVMPNGIQMGPGQPLQHIYHWGQFDSGPASSDSPGLRIQYSQPSTPTMVVANPSMHSQQQQSAPVLGGPVAQQHHQFAQPVVIQQAARVGGMQQQLPRPPPGAPAAPYHQQQQHPHQQQQQQPPWHGHAAQSQGHGQQGRGQQGKGQRSGMQGRLSGR